MKNLHQLPGEKREIIPVFATSALQNTVSGNHSFAVPKGLLAELINRLIALVPVERIYLSEYVYHAHAFEELTILMPHSSKMHIAEARPLVNMLMATYPSYRYRLFYAPEVKAALDKGSIAFFTICRPENLIYQFAESNFTWSATDLSAGSILEKINKAFEQELEKVAGFKAGFRFYFRQGNYPLAALMIHQAIELNYRAAELLVIGREKISHAIRSHQKFMKPYIPELGTIFNGADETDMALLDLLDEAYQGVRYENAYQVSEEQLCLFMEKAGLVEKRTVALYEFLVARFVQQGFTVPGVPSLAAGEGDLLQQIVTQLSALLPVYQIYHMGHRRLSDQYCLLVIAEEVCAAEVPDVQSIIVQNKKVTASVILLVHTMKDVQEALDDNDRFFHDLLRNGRMVYQNPGALESLNLVRYEASSAQTQTGLCWYRQSGKAAALLMAAENVGCTITADDANLVKALLLNQAMEQVCLGFIALSTGYKPRSQSLKQLFMLCRCISTRIDVVFPRGSGAEQKIFQLLLDVAGDLRYQTPVHINDDDLALLQQRCSNWMDAVQDFYKNIC